MRQWITGVFFCLVACSPAWAQLPPKEVVASFYQDYTQAMNAPTESWVKTLMSRQKANLEQPLIDGMLRLADGDPSKGEPYLDFDPFSNSQVGLESYRLGEPSQRDGLVYVPVLMGNTGYSGPPRMRARFVLRDSGSGWKIANVVYPAEDGMPSWDLRGYLQETFAK